MFYMAWQDSTKIHRYTLSEISCMTQISRRSPALMEIFFTSQGSVHILARSVLFLNCLNIFRILLSMNLIHLITVSYHHVCQERQFQTKVSLLFLTFYVRATIDSDPPRDPSISPCCLVRNNLEALKKDRLINIITLHSWYI